MASCERSLYNDILLNFFQTEVGPIVHPDRPASPPRSLHCYNYGYQGHHGHVSNVFELLFLAMLFLLGMDVLVKREGVGGWWSN